MKLVRNSAAAEIDRLTQSEYGIPGPILMENAGIRLFEALEKELAPEKDSSMVVLAGGGNNGGDALVMARQALNAGYSNLHIILLKEQFSGLAAQWLEVCGKLGIGVTSFINSRKEAEAILTAANIILDGISGTGLKGALRGAAAECARWLSGTNSLVVAVDAPSGVGEDFRGDFPVVCADLTFTVSPGKIALYNPVARPFCGKIIHVNIGFPSSLVENAPGAILMDEFEVRSMVTPFAKTAYKGTRGHCAVFAGAKGTLGAGLLAAEAAARSGAGLVTLFIDENVYTPAASSLRPVMVRPLAAAAIPEIDRFSTVLIGPGWGLESRDTLLNALLASFSRGVIDADGLTLLAQTGLKAGPGWVLTPHPGECARLLGCSTENILEDPFKAASKTAEKYNATVLLKGFVSCAVSPDGRTAVIDGMNPLTATGGSGDVLAGITAGIMAAEDSDSFNAAAASAFLHQEAGRAAALSRGVFTADDLLPEVGRKVGELRNAGA